MEDCSGYAFPDRFSESKHLSATMDADDESEGCHAPTLHTLEDPENAIRASTISRPVKRRETEARRFSGKENVEEYLLQFELTAKRNVWNDDEKSSALLCALDGSARGILAEFDDPIAASYADVKRALLRRFGPTQLVEVHEQALAQLRLSKGQGIRELAHEVQRLVKQAYPDILGPARNRLAVKHLLNAVHDKDTVFYIREKNPQDIMEACQLYERYTALVNEDNPNRRTNIRGVNEGRENPAPASVDTADLQRQVTDAIDRITAATDQQLQKLSTAMAQLSSTHPAVPVEHAPRPSIQTPASDSRPPFVPRRPCPRCGQVGHWARDCTQGQHQAPPTDACFRCGRSGHRQRDCNAPLNWVGPTPAPGAGPRPPLRP